MFVVYVWRKKGGGGLIFMAALTFLTTGRHWDLFNIRKELMGLGEHSLQEAQPLRAGVDEQCE